MVNTDRVEYSLFHKDFGTQIITEPEGWKDDEKEYARVDEYDGIFVRFSNNLTFVKDGAGFLAMIYNMYGINEDVILRKRERHPHTNVWMNTYMGYLDFSTYEFQNNKVTIKFDSGGIEQLLKTRMKDDFEIERLDTIEGRPLPELPVETIVLNGRRIFLKSVLKGSEEETNAFETMGAFRSPLMYYESRMDERIQPVLEDFIPYFPNIPFQWSDLQPTGLNHFYYNNDRNKTLTIKGSFRVRSTPNFYHFLDAAIVVTDENQNPVPSLCSYVYQSGWTSEVWQDFEFEHTLELLEGYGIVFMLVSQVSPPGSTSTLHTLNYERQHLEVNEDSYFPPTTTKAILAHELGQRLTQIITNRDDAFYSEALGRTDIGYLEDGANTGALNGFAHGMWIRGFDKEPQDDENRYKPFTTSFQDYIENLKATWNLALGIEKIGYKERLRIEKKSFFYNQNVTIHIGYQENGKWVYPKVKNLKRTPSSDHYYSDITVGFEKGWENEEAQGLDEYNTQTTFTTPITRISNKFEAISNYIFASYAKEFIRRKPKLNYPTTDHKNDKEIFGMDLKRDPINGYTERLWQDDFETEPTGVFSPETATNLRLTPINTLLRHARNIMAGLTKLSTQMIRYASSEGNSNLTTQQIGQQAYTENNDILISDMERPYYVAEYVEFEYPVNFELLQQVEGYTEILGKRVPNFYGLVRFRNENNDLETGFLINLKPNNQGQWKLLKHNR